MKKVFVSYHFVTSDGKLNGFGNYMGKFNPESYQDEPEKFILHLQKTIADQLKDKIKKKVNVKVLFFR